MYIYGFNIFMTTMKMKNSQNLFAPASDSGTPTSMLPLKGNMPLIVRMS